MSLSVSLYRLSVEGPLYVVVALGVAAAFAAVSFLRTTLAILNFVKTFSFPSDNIARYQKNGAYALVTGATQGIGEYSCTLRDHLLLILSPGAAFVDQLAARGFNVVLHGRSAAKLEAQVKQLSADYPRLDFRYAIADAVAEGDEHGIPAAVARIARQVSKLPGPLTVLVNNVGGLQGVYGNANPFVALHDSTAEAIDGTISINVRFTTHITSALLPLLSEPRSGNPEPTPFLVLNVGSLASTYGCPYLSVYSGSKAYLNTWAEGLEAELSMQPRYAAAEILTVLSGETTEASTIDKPQTLMLPNATTFAKAAVSQVGCGRRAIAPYWGHALQAAIMDCLPRSALRQSMISSIDGLTAYWDEKALRALKNV